VDDVVVVSGHSQVSYRWLAGPSETLPRYVISPLFMQWHILYTEKHGKGIR